MKYVINKYDLNGKHTVLDSENKPILFDSKQSAKDYLRKFGCSEEFIETVDIEEATNEYNEVFIKSTLL